MMPAPDITMWNNADGRWMAHLSYNPLIRDTYDEAHAAAVKFWREHTAAGMGAAQWLIMSRIKRRNDILQGMVNWQARRIELLESQTTKQAIAERMFK